MKTIFAYTIPLKMALIKLVEKTLMACRKSVKTAKVFSHVTFIVYGILK